MMAKDNPNTHHPEPVPTSKGTIAMHFNLLSQNYVKTVIGYMVEVGGHYIHNDAFKLVRLNNDMFAAYGGVNHWTR